jgi:hypothetical protein
MNAHGGHNLPAWQDIDNTELRGRRIRCPRLSVVVVLITAIALAFAPPDGWAAVYDTIYTSENLSGHVVNPECNPGGGTSCEGCGADDVSIESEAAYGRVTANTNGENIWVNAIGGKLFIEAFPDGAPISLGTYRYSYQVRLPVMPAPDVGQQENPEGVHLVAILWDGRNELFQSDRYSLEAGLYWSVNAWNLANNGKLMVYTDSDPIRLIDTGATLPPDTGWHTFEMIIDFVAQKYVSITIDGETTMLGDVDLPKVARPDWGNEVALIITQESMSAWPTEDCDTVFSWTTEFRDVRLGRLRETREESVPAVDGWGFALLACVLAAAGIYFARRNGKARGAGA